MVEVKITLANGDVPMVQEWIEETQEALIEDMIAPLPTPESNRATLVYTLLGLLDAKLAAHVVNLVALEEAAKAARRK